MTDTTTLEATSAAPRRSGSLTALKLAELQGLASSMGISGTAKMRKNDLVEAIKARQGGAGAAPVARAERAGRSEDADRPERTNRAGRTGSAERTGGAERTGSAERVEPAPTGEQTPATTDGGRAGAGQGERRNRRAGRPAGEAAPSPTTQTPTSGDG
ncbi:MAG: Rho termination factor N-terminal domain-containing protein, partial [Nostocoides sp.]